MFRYIKRFFRALVLLIVVIIVGLYLFDFGYILKGVRVVYLTGHTTAFIDDYPYFENDTIAKGDQTWNWPQHTNYNTVSPTQVLEKTHEAYGTIAYLIIKNDSIWYEDYAKNYGQNSKTNGFSMSKSITTALLGKAIKDGFITSLDQPIGDFYPQYKQAATTVGDLASMASGLDWQEHYTSPFSTTARAYYDDNLAKTILNQKVTETPGKAYKYLSGNSQLLGMIIQKATGKQLSQYLSESFWQPLGMQSNALWQLDDDKHRLAKTYCCIASNARDFARFGRLFKNHGNWNGQQILDSTFTAISTKARFDGEPYGYGFWISNFMEKDIFVMRGILGQYVITIPEDDLIIVRLGHERGKFVGAPFTDDFYIYVEEAYTMLKK